MLLNWPQNASVTDKKIKKSLTEVDSIMMYTALLN